MTRPIVSPPLAAWDAEHIMAELERLSTLTTSQSHAAQALAFAQWARCLYQAKGGIFQAQQLFLEQHPRSLSRDFIEKAATAAGTTTDTTFAGALAVPQLAQGFLEYLRPRTVLGRLPARRVAWNVSSAVQTSGPSFSWIGEGAAAPAMALAFATVSPLVPGKVSGMIVLTRELLRAIDPVADRQLRDELARGAAAFFDAAMLDPTIAEVANVSPASITNGAPSAAASGTTPAAAATDVKGMVAAFFAANADATAPVLIMSPANAVAIAVALNSQTFGAQGGTLFGIPVITSAAASNRIILVDADQVLFAEDDAALAIDVSEHATIEMNDTPANPTVDTTIMTNLFQRNLAAVRLTRFASWRRVRTNAVRLVTGAAYA